MAKSKEPGKGKHNRYPAKKKATFIAPIVAPGGGMRAGSARHIHDKLVSRIEKNKSLNEIVTQSPKGRSRIPINHLLTNQKFVEIGLRVMTKLLTRDKDLQSMKTECDKEVISAERKNFTYILRDTFRDPMSSKLLGDLKTNGKNRYEVVATTPPYDLRSFYVGLTRQAIYTEQTEFLYPAITINDFMMLFDKCIDVPLAELVDLTRNVDVLLPVISSHVILKIQNKNKYLDTFITIYVLQARRIIHNDPEKDWFDRNETEGLLMPKI